MEHGSTAEVVLPCLEIFTLSCAKVSTCYPSMKSSVNASLTILIKGTDFMSLQVFTKAERKGKAKFAYKVFVESLSLGHNDSLSGLKNLGHNDSNLSRRLV